MKKILTDKQKAIRTCNLGTMTPAMKTNMIRSSLRKISMYWLPIQECKKLAKLDRRERPTGILYHNPTKTMPERESNTVMINFYKCNKCKKAVPEKTFTFKEKFIKSKMLWQLKTFEIKFANNLAVDHINPVITDAWFKWWTEFIDRLLDEDASNYQLLCKECHKELTHWQSIQRKNIKE